MILGPNEQSILALLKDTGNSTVRVEFRPKFVGEHKIYVSYKNVPLAGSPFSCKVYDLNAIKVKPLFDGTVGQPLTFTVETSQAGPGNLEVAVNDGKVPATAQIQGGAHTYAISFTPKQALAHLVHLRFNGENVPGSPFSCSINEAPRVILLYQDKVCVDKLAEFAIECKPSTGAPQVQILSPTGHRVPVQIGPVNSNGKYSAQFVPNDVGDYSVEVKLNENHVEGSPFLIKAYDANKVHVANINSAFVGCPAHFTIDASRAGAGNLEVIVSVNGCNVPNFVESKGNAKFRVNFRPREMTAHNLSVRFNGDPVPGSPFACQIFEPGNTTSVNKATDENGLKTCHVNRPACIAIDSLSHLAVCKVAIISPDGRQLPTDSSIRTDKKLITKFTPTQVGRHIINVETDDGHPIEDSRPLICNAYDAERINVTGLGTGQVDKPVTFRVDATEAGEGTLELVISTEHNTVEARVVPSSRGLYNVTFVPHQLLPHFVNISFNGERVPGAPFCCEIVESPSGTVSVATAAGEGLNQVILGSTAYFYVNPHSSNHGVIETRVIGPDGEHVATATEKLESGSYRIKYKPLLVGTHSITILHRERLITRNPCSVEVFDPSSVKIYDISDVFCDQPATFKVDTRKAGNGSLTINIEAAGSEAKHSIRELDASGVYEIVYHPKIPIPHRIRVKYNDVCISESPWEMTVQDPAVGKEVRAIGLGLYQSRANHVSSFTIHTAGYPHHDFDVVVTGPEGNAVPVRCYQQKDGNLLAEFNATNTGGYKIDVSHGSRPVRRSPFLCHVYDASNVRIENLSDRTGIVGDNISFNLMKKKAGVAEMDVTVRNAIGERLPSTVKNVGADIELVEFCPSASGNYFVDITYGGDSIPDTPLRFNVIDSGVARVWGLGLSKAKVDTPSKFFVSTRGISKRGKPVVQITGPNRSIIYALVAPAKSGNDGEYDVTFTADVVGTYDIHVILNGKRISGSPYRCSVVNVDQVHPIGDNASCGKLSLAVNTTTKMVFDVSQAGPGELVGTCEGPHGSTLPVNIEHLGSDIVQCYLTPSSAGPHSLCLLYGGFPLPSSPFHGLAESSDSNVKVLLTGEGLASANCGQTAKFTIDGSKAGPGIPQVTLTGIEHDIRVSLERIGNGIFEASYTPTNPGVYLLNVVWSDRHVKGCPLKVVVNSVCDASKVLCTEDGLDTLTLGKDMRSFIDTRGAGSGELSAHCVGPHKIAYCELYDHGDGTFTLNVEPQESGKHTLTVKYGGVNVPGSPYILQVSGAPDPSKVHVYGPGIEHGVLATFQSRFICDTRGAGAGQLTVRVRGPKGAFRVEMQRESQKDRAILCKYDPTEPGDYKVEVQWAGEHVPGSPFVVLIFDTQHELNGYLQGNHSPASDLYASLTYSTGYAHITP